MRLERILQAVLALLAASSSGDARSEHGSDRIADLLRLPAPLPRWGEPHGSPITPAAAGSFVSPTAPGDDAPLDVLAGYWAEHAAVGRGEGPTDVVRQRLVEACTLNPSRLPSLLGLLPDAPEAHDRIGQLLSEPSFVSRLGEEEKTVREWLRRRSGWLREDLVGSAREATDDDGGWVDGQEDLEALARLDWAQAEPDLLAHIRSEAPRTSALAMAVAYEHYASAGKTAEAAGYRGRYRPSSRTGRLRVRRGTARS